MKDQVVKMEHWLKDDCQTFFSTKLYDNNRTLNRRGNNKAIKASKRYIFVVKLRKG